MNKHFSAILAIMDAAEIVPDDIRYTTKKDILITAELPMSPVFIREMENYCVENDLRFTGSVFPNPYFLVLNPKNA